MRNLVYFICLGLIFSCEEPQPPAPEYKNEKFQMPEEIYGDFFNEIQVIEAIPSKKFADAIPKRKVQDIYNDYRRAKNDYDFKLEDFLSENFEFEESENAYKKDSARAIENTIDLLWKEFKKPPHSASPEGSTLISLPYAYAISRQDEINDVYYWDSYFVMLGLQANEDLELMENMVDNFAYLINEVGHIPHYNRTYATTRSQQPIFVEMIKLLSEEKGSSVFEKYLPAMEKEYKYWMKGSAGLIDSINAYEHVVKVKDNVLNRYWDENTTPRPAHYKSDVQTSQNVSWRAGWETLRELRAGTESGWNFGGRYLSNARWRGSVRTTEILPIDLNCLLYELEKTIGETYARIGNESKSSDYQEKASKRKSIINDLFWSTESGLYLDYLFKKEESSERQTLAMLYPLFFNIADKEKADSVVLFLQDELVKSGGVVTSTNDTYQRWDAPHGWAQLQYITIQALKNYGYNELANKVADRWISMIEKVYDETGLFLEYYDIVEIEENYDQDKEDHFNFAPTMAVYEVLKKK